MQTLKVADKNVQDAAHHAAAIIRGGGVVLFPTDTLYGLGADAFSDAAVDTIFSIKGRDEGKPVHALVSSMAMASAYGDVNQTARQLLEKLPRGQLTLIVRKKRGLASGICRRIDTFGFRIPDSALCLALVDAFGAPVTATSANASGLASPPDVDGILAQLGERAAGIELVLDGGTLPSRNASTVVDCTGARPVILRESAIPAAAVWDALAPTAEGRK